jgi:uncharacterized protein (TIGR02271 family)
MTATEPEPIERDAQDNEASVVRSEEVLQTGTETVVTDRLTLRKRVVTEMVTQTVELRREELVIERETMDPDTGSEHDSAEPEYAFNDADYEIVLHAERAVLSTYVVPIERVRLSTRVVTEAAAVTENLRREQVEVEEIPESR